MKQTLIVTLDVTSTPEAQLHETLDYLLAMPRGKERLNLKYNLVDIDQEDVIAAEHALIDMLERDRQKAVATRLNPDTCDHFYYRSDECGVRRCDTCKVVIP